LRKLQNDIRFFVLFDLFHALNPETSLPHLTNTLYIVPGPLHFSQIEDVKLSRKVLYYFVIDSIVNEILIFENRWMRTYPFGPPLNGSTRRCMLVPLSDIKLYLRILHVYRTCIARVYRISAFRYLLFSTANL